MFRSLARLTPHVVAFLFLIGGPQSLFTARAGTLSLGQPSLNLVYNGLSVANEFNNDVIAITGTTFTGSGTLNLSASSDWLNAPNNGSSFFLINNGSLDVGGGSIIIIHPSNRAPVGNHVVKHLPYGPITAPTEYRIGLAELATDPDNNLFRITSVQGSPNAELIEGGGAVRVVTMEPVTLTATIVDSWGATTTATVQVISPPVYRKTETRLVQGAEANLIFEVPTLGFSRSEVWVEFTKHAFSGSTHFTEDGHIRYAPMNGVIGDDSFIFEVRKDNIVIAEITAVIRNVVSRVRGTYMGLSQDGRWIVRVTIDLSGEYTATVRSATTTYRRKGNLTSEDGGSADEFPVLRFRFTSSVDNPELRASLSTPATTGQEVILWTEDELGTLPAPRIHAQLNNSVGRVRVVAMPGGGFVPRAGSFRILSSSYMIMLGGSGPNVIVAGRLHDGRPWAGSCFVLADGEIPLVGGNLNGWLSSHRSGRVTGALFGSDPSKGLVKATVGGSAFTPRAAGANVLNGQLTPIQVRSPFPVDVAVPAHLDRFGGIKTKTPRGVVYDLQVGSRDGTVSGTISLPAINQSRRVNGLFIPHRQSIVGFVGDTAAKPLTITRK